MLGPGVGHILEHGRPGVDGEAGDIRVDGDAEEPAEDGDHEGGGRPRGPGRQQQADDVHGGHVEGGEDEDRQHAGDLVESQVQLRGDLHEQPGDDEGDRQQHEQHRQVADGLAGQDLVAGHGVGQHEPQGTVLALAADGVVGEEQGQQPEDDLHDEGHVDGAEDDHVGVGGAQPLRLHRDQVVGDLDLVALPAIGADAEDGELAGRAEGLQVKDELGVGALLLQDIGLVVALGLVIGLAAGGIVLDHGEGAGGDGDDAEDQADGEAVGQQGLDELLGGDGAHDHGMGTTVPVARAAPSSWPMTPPGSRRRK